MLNHVSRKIGLSSQFAINAHTPHIERIGAYVWHILPAGITCFGRDGLAIDKWLASSKTHSVKSGTQRTICRVVLPAGAVVIKQSRINTPRAWAREILRPAKARLEFENAMALRELGLPAAEPLAWGSRHSRLPGESILITRSIDAGHPLDRFLETTPLRSALRQRIAVELGKLLANMHDVGVAHPDPHPGNLLVETAGGVPQFTLLDVHAVRFGAPLTVRERIDNLVLFSRWFQLRATRADRLRFWQAYRDTATAGVAIPRILAVEVERRTSVSNQRFWNGRFARYCRTNRLFKRQKGHRTAGHAVRDLEPAFFERLLTDPDYPFREANVVVRKDSRSSTVIEWTVATKDGPRTWIYKRFRVKSALALLKNRLRASPAMRSWLYGQNLLERWLPTARPLCVIERKRFGGSAEGYSLFEKVPDALDLVEAVARLPNFDANMQFRIKSGWASALGRLIRTLHDRQVSHRDLKAPNILLQNARTRPLDAVPVLIDLVGVVPGREVPRKVRIRDLARLNASFIGNPLVTRTDRLRVLRAYQVWALYGKVEWKAVWRAIEIATRAKREKNAKSGRPLS